MLANTEKKNLFGKIGKASRWMNIFKISMAGKLYPVGDIFNKVF